LPVVYFYKKAVDMSQVYAFIKMV